MSLTRMPNLDRRVRVGDGDAMTAEILTKERNMRPTVLIGLDGLTYTILDHLIDEGVMPFLRRFMADGVHAELMSTPNPHSAPGWTSMTTGRRPGNHGVFDFVRVLQGYTCPRLMIATSRDVCCETVWSIAGRQGCRAAALDFPIMFPPRPLNGYVVPGFVPGNHLRRLVYPSEFYDRIAALPDFRPDELLLNLDAEAEALQVLEEDLYEQWILLHIRRERQWAGIVRYLMVNEPCALTGIVFDGPDKLFHRCWRFIDPAFFPAAPSERELKIRNLCLDYFRQLDSIVEEITGLAGPDSRVFVASDHGFGPTSEIFYVNALLQQLGYVKWAKGVVPDTQGRQTMEGHKSPVVLFDWEQTSAFALTAGSNGIYIRLPKDATDRRSETERYAEFRQALIGALSGFTDGMTGEPVVRKIMTRENAFPGRQTHLAPDLTLTLRDGGFISVLNSNVIVKPRDEIAGTHRPAGVFLARGPGIARSAHVAPFDIEDITPLLLYSLGLDLPEDLDGKLNPHVFEREQLQAFPPRTGRPTQPLTPFFEVRRDREGDSDIEAQIKQRLRDLEYY
jgi:predicted AlkP superfamily phosphohydrolase/phosphomutase